MPGGNQTGRQKSKKTSTGVVIQLRFGNQTTVIRQRDLLHLLDPDAGRAMLRWLAGTVATLPNGWTVEMKLVECGSDQPAATSR
jgi:hypothetical protein